MQQERFLGRGTRGPYMLSLQGIEARTEQVFRNGIRLEAGRDFMLDPALGMMSFTEPLRPTDVVNITYSFEPDKARKPGPAAGSLGLVGGNSGGLALNYGFKADALGNQSLASLGFNGEAELGGGKLMTNFMMDKTAGPDAGREAQNMQFALKNDQGRFKYDLGYTRVGTKFKPADALKLLKGSEALNIDTSLQFSNSGALTFKKANNVTPDAKKGTLTTALETAGLNVDIAPGSRLTALHERKSSEQGNNAVASAVDRLQLDQKLGAKSSATLIQETVSQSKNGQGETIEATRLNARTTGDNGLTIETALALTDSDKRGEAREAGMKMALGDGPTKMTMAVNDRKADFGDLRTHALGLQTVRGGLTFKASVQGDKTDKGHNDTNQIGVEGKAAETLTWGLGLASYSGTNKSGSGTMLSLSGKAGNNVSFSAARQDDSTEQRGSTASTKLALGLNGIKNLKLDASMLDDTLGNKPVESKRLNFEATPLDAVKLTATHASDLNEKGDVASTRVQMEATAARVVKIAANHSMDAKNNVAKEATGFNIEAAPVDAFKVSASLVDSKDNKGEGQTQAVSVEAKPMDAMKVSATLTDGKATTGDTTIREAAIAMTPVKDKLSFSGSLRDEQREDREIQTSVLQADVKPADALAMTAYYKQRDTGEPERIDTVDAQFTLKADEALQMIGTFTQNPEEKNKILRLVRRGLTLKSQIGALTFSGGYVTEESLIDESEGAHAEFKLGLRFNKHAELQGGFQQTVGAIRGYKPMLAYNMRYDHNVGSDFHLLLEGNVTQRDNNVPEDQRQEVKATANLGLRF